MAKTMRYKGCAGARKTGGTGERRKRRKFMGNETQQEQSGNGSEPEGFITKEEVAKRLKKTVRTVENWQRKGILPFVKAERSVLFRWSDVVAHLEGNFRVCRRGGIRG